MNGDLSTLPQDLPKYRIEPTPRHLLDETLRDYVCSTCWSPLSFDYVDKQWFAICPECKEETAGYISKNFADRRRKESEQEYLEAQRNLREVLGMKPEKHSVAENLKALGF